MPHSSHVFLPFTNRGGRTIWNMHPRRIGIVVSHHVTKSTRGQFHSQGKDTKGSSTDRCWWATFVGRAGHSWHTWIHVVQKINKYISLPLCLGLCFVFFAENWVVFFPYIYNWHFLWLSLIKHLDINSQLGLEWGSRRGLLKVGVAWRGLICCLRWHIYAHAHCYPRPLQSFSA